jgi:hypothetical protein
MAILGESFKQYVKDQINVRQEKLSSQYKDNDLLTYLTSKTSFLRLTSGVNVTNDILKAYDLPLSYIADNGLAKMCVLEGARFRASEDSQPNFTSNVGYDNPLSSYGFLSNSDYGFVPPPGITQAIVKTLNRGTIREATIQLVCHNIQQFHVISILFLKLKYSLLLEWGHTIFYDNEGNLKRGYDIPNLSNDFLAGQTSQAEFLKKMENEREKSNGNYDAFFGLVKNFQWEAQENGSYVVTIDALSTGDIIESIKLNVNLDPDNDKEGAARTEETQTFSKSTFHKILGAIRQNSKLIRQSYMDGYNTGDGNCLNTLALAALTGLTFNYKEELDTNETLQQRNNILTDREAVQVNFPDLQTSQDQNGQWQSNNQFYIKLGTLLRIVESFLLFYDTTKNILPPSGSSPSDTSQKSPPIFHINHDFETNECLTTVNQLPVDPRVALIPLAGTSNATKSEVRQNVLVVKRWFINVSFSNGVATESISGEYSNSVNFIPEGRTENDTYVLDYGDLTNWDGGNNPATGVTSNMSYNTVKSILKKGPPDPTTNNNVWIGFGVERYYQTSEVVPEGNVGPLKHLGTEFRDGSPSQFIGKTMHIYINIDYIVSVLDNNIDKDGNVALQPFLTTLLSGVSTALGCINKFELDYDDVTNTFFIIDSALIPIKYKGKNEVVKFNVNSLTPSTNEGGSFVTSFGLKSDIYSSIGNAIAIGAQAGGNSLMSNSTSFSGFNSGIVDRFLTVKDNKNIKLNPTASVDQEAKIQARFNEFKVRLTSTRFGTALNPVNIDYFRSYVVDLLQHDLGYATQTNQIPGTTFIPLNLHLTMDGISGMRQYQVFTITENLLPKEYYDRVKFITTVIEHKIDTKGWETTVNTVGIPKKDEAKEITIIPKPITPVDTSVSEIKAKQLNTSASPKKVDTSGKCTPREDGKGYYHTGFEPQFKTREPRSITIHHTAGEGSAQGIIYSVGACGRGADANPPWNEQGGIHWAIGIDGEYKQGIPEDKRSIHGHNWNKHGIGIEVANIGMITGTNSQGIPSNPDGVLARKNPVVVDLGFTFNGHSKWQEYTDTQVSTLKGLISEILTRYPKIQEAIQGQNVYKHVWNLPGTPKVGDKVRSSQYTENYGKYGIFAHSTSTKIKSDMGPTPKIVNMLLSFGFVE